MNLSDLPEPVSRAERRTVSDELFDRFIRKHRSPNHLKKLRLEQRRRVPEQVAAIAVRAFEEETNRLRVVVENARLADLCRQTHPEQPRYAA